MKIRYLYPWKSKQDFLNVFSGKTSVLVRVSNQQFQGNIFLMVFDFQVYDILMNVGGINWA